MNFLAMLGLHKDLKTIRQEEAMHNKDALPKEEMKISTTALEKKYIETLICDFREFFNLVNVLVAEAGPIGISTKFFEELKLAPFMAITEVLSDQGNISDMQETVLKSLINQTEPKYNFAQIREAGINRTGIYDEFMLSVGIKNYESGSFWKAVFELIYRTGLNEQLSKILSALAAIGAMFEHINNGDVEANNALTRQFQSAIGQQVMDYQDAPPMHALIIALFKLQELFSIGLSEFYLVAKPNENMENRNYFVYDAYYKSDNKSIGVFAILEESEEEDVLILKWDNEVNHYKTFYSGQ